VYLLTEYTDPSTGQPSFYGNVAFVITSSGPSSEQSYFNLSSVPTSAVSASWKRATAAWLESYYPQYSITPVESMSVAVCSPNYVIEPWIIEFVNGSVTLIQRQSQGIGNLDPRQLNISIQDCFNLLPQNPPYSGGLSVDIFMLLGLTTADDGSSFAPTPESLTSNINMAIPTSVQASHSGRALLQNPRCLFQCSFFLPN
jgi:hypothetical protein